MFLLFFFFISLEIEETALHPVAEVKVDVFMQDENLRQASESEFYKRSDSTDKQTTSTLESQDGASSDLRQCRRSFLIQPV
jgi:hypothetical protein